jgi:hypothetical protein
MIFYGNQRIGIDFNGNEQILSKRRDGFFCERWDI